MISSAMCYLGIINTPHRIDRHSMASLGEGEWPNGDLGDVMEAWY